MIIEKIMELYPHLDLNIYVGMAREGVSQENHVKYNQLMREYSGLRIYYKVYYPLTHIKLYQFIKNDNHKKAYVGSANFSEAGFFSNQELLVESNSNFEDLFNEIKNKSLLCTDSEVYTFVNFFDEDGEPISNIPEYIEESPKVVEEKSKNSTEKNDKLRIMRSLRRNLTSTNYDLKIPVMLESGKFNDNKGINAWARKQTPYLRQSNKYPFSNYFPTDREFTVIFEDGNIFEGNINTGKATELKMHPDFYMYLKNKLHIAEQRPITYEELKENNLLEIKVYKLENNEYFFKFESTEKQEGDF